jgi:Mannosyltransferase (PIG-V)
MVRSDLRIVAFAVIVRLLSVGIAFTANVTFPLYQPEQFTVSQQGGHTFWNTFARYDSGWYYGIARNGYQYVQGGRSNLAFFPLYPILMRHVGRLFGTRAFDYYLGGIIISWLAFVMAMLVLHRLASLDLSPPEADRAVAFAAIFPFAFFHGVVYTESLFLLLTLATFYGFRTRRWALGGIAGALATATRPNGVLMWPALAWIAWRESRGDRAQQWRAGIAWVLVPAGLITFAAYVYTISGSWLEWYATLKRWGYEPGTNDFSVYGGLVRAILTRPYAFLATERAAPYDLLNAGAAAIALVAVPFVWRRLGGAYALLMIANLYVPLSSGQLEGIGRYCTVLFPMFLWLATLASPITQCTLMAGFAMFYALCLALFVNIHPIF